MIPPLTNNKEGAAVEKYDATVGFVCSTVTSKLYCLFLSDITGLLFVPL